MSAARPAVPTAALAAVELLGALVLAVGAVLAWGRGTRTAEFPTVAGPTPVVGTFYSGPWLLLAVGAATLAALLVVLAAGVLLRRR